MHINQRANAIQFRCSLLARIDRLPPAAMRARNEDFHSRRSRINWVARSMDARLAARFDAMCRIAQFVVNSVSPAIIPA